MKILNREPVLFMFAIQAAIGLVVAFGLHLSPEQIGALVTFSAAVLGLIARSKVTPIA